MSAAILAARGGTLVPPASQRGYHVPYRGDGHDSCPGCGRRHFYVGRVSAECGFCATALPLLGAPLAGGGGSWREVRRP